MDSSLSRIQEKWSLALEQGLRAMEDGTCAAALPLLSRAVNESARFHPLFHFLESGLNTELAALHLERENFDEAARYFERAIFLHHDNETAIQGKNLAQLKVCSALPAYSTLSFSAELPAGEIHFLRQQAQEERGEHAVLLYHEAIEHCEAAHQHYHRLAALPWLARARCFMAMSEETLARNDVRRGMDLDRNNPELQKFPFEIVGAGFRDADIDDIARF